MDAYNIMVQRQLTDTMSIEVGLRRQPRRDVVRRRRPGREREPADTRRLPGRAHEPAAAVLRRPCRRTYRRASAARYGWTQGIDYFCNCAQQRYDSLQTKIQQALLRRLRGAGQLHVPEGGAAKAASYFFWDPTSNRGSQDWDRTHMFNVALRLRAAVRQGQAVWAGTGRLDGRADRRLAVQREQTFQSGVPFNVEYAGAGADRDVGPNRPNLIGDPERRQDARSQWFNTTPIGARAARSDPASGTFGNLERNALRGPGYCRTDASLFKHFRIGGRRKLEVRIEAVNLFNHVNLGNPDSEIGTPGNTAAERGPHQLDGVRERRSAAERAVRGEV